MILFLFGQSGAGKSYVGKVLQDEFSYYFYEGDTHIPDSMRQAIQTESKITEKMRDEFFEQLFTHVQRKSKNEKNIVVAQTFIKERFRKQALRLFPEAVFIWIKASPKVRQHRIAQRNEMQMSKEYVKKMDRRFQKPEIPYLVIENNSEGKNHIMEQMYKLKLNTKPLI